MGAGVQNPFGANFASRMASGIVSQGVRMMVYGGGKMDFAAIAADAFGNAVGDDIVGKMKTASVAAAEKVKQDKAVAEQIQKPMTAEDVADSQPGASEKVSGEQKADKPEDHIVQKGESLTSIAKKLAGKGATAEEINNKKNQLAAANPELSDLNLIHPGDKLKLPDENTKVDGATMARAVAADNADSAKREVRQQGAAQSAATQSSPVNGGALPEIDFQERYAGGVTKAASMGWSEAMNTNNSWGERLVFGGLSAIATPAAMLESALYAPFNIRADANEAGQYSARASMQSDTDLRNLDLLNAVALSASAFDSAGSIFGGVKPPVGVVQRGSAGIVDDVGENWGTGSLRASARPILKNEDTLIDASHGLQSRVSGLFDNVQLGQYDEVATKYLYTVDQRGVNIALEQTPFPTPRGNVVHTNISSKASIGGEAWFGQNNSVTINAGSGRFGDAAGITNQQWGATVKLWESLGYEVNPIPFGKR